MFGAMPAPILILAPVTIFHFAGVNSALRRRHHLFSERAEMFKRAWFGFSH